MQLSGLIDALNADGEKLTAVLRLNSESNVRHRARWIRTLIACQVSDPQLFLEYLAYPDDLPDLRPPATRVPRNSKPESVNGCFFALRERGGLSETY